MSVTTTANPLTYTLQSTLADYDLHHSDSPESSIDQSLNTHPAPLSHGTPSSWPTEHRRIPEYRPVNTELDQSERRVFLSGVEQVFVGVMFTGVYLQSVSQSCIEWRWKGAGLMKIGCFAGLEGEYGEGVECCV
jgi:hypothetical protein